MRVTSRLPAQPSEQASASEATRDESDVIWSEVVANLHAEVTMREVGIDDERRPSAFDHGVERNLHPMEEEADGCAHHHRGTTVTVVAAIVVWSRRIVAVATTTAVVAIVVIAPPPVAVTGPERETEACTDVHAEVHHA